MAYPRTGNERCEWTFRDGRRCRLNKRHDETLFCHLHEDLCEAHLSRMREINEKKPIVEATDRLHRARDINRVLGRLLREVDAGRTSAKEAVQFAYLAQTMLATLPHMERQHDRRAASKEKQQANLTSSIATAIGFGIMQRMHSGAPGYKERAEEQFHSAREGFEELERKADADEAAASQQTASCGDAFPTPGAEPQTPAPKEEVPDAE